MAARLTDKQKKKIVADYVELGSYNATAKLNGVSLNTVKHIVQANAEIAEMCNQKKEENTASILDYMDAQKDRVCQIIGVVLEVLPDKIRDAKSASEVTTAMGTLIDKFTRQLPSQKIEMESSLSLADKLKAIQEAAERYGH